MLGLTGRMIGGGLGSGRVEACAGAAALLCDSGMRSTTVALLGFFWGSGMTPSVRSTSSRPALTPIASASSVARRRAGVNSCAERRR